MIPDHIQKKIDEYLLPLKDHVGNISIKGKREDIEFGYSLAESEITQLKEKIARLEKHLAEYDKNYAKKHGIV